MTTVLDHTFTLTISSLLDLDRFPMDPVPAARLRLPHGERCPPRQVSREHGPQETRPSRSRVHGEGQGPSHVDVPEMRRGGA